MRYSGVFKFTYLILISVFVLQSCRLSEHVPENRYLLKKNSIKVQGDKIAEDDILTIIRQKSNTKTVGVNFKLWMYNQIDSTRVAEKRVRKNLKIQQKNEKRRKKEFEINEKRIQKARANGDSLFTRKTIELIDTENPSMFLREWLKYKIGEAPVIFDTMLYQKTLDQLSIFLKQKGYYEHAVSGTVLLNDKKRTAVVKYNLSTGHRIMIDSVVFVSNSGSVTSGFHQFEKTENGNLVGMPLDYDVLSDYRDRLAKFLRDDAIYGFSSSNITYKVDTLNKSADYRATVKLIASDKVVQKATATSPEVTTLFRVTNVRNVYFHICDTLNVLSNYKQELAKRGLTFSGMDVTQLPTLDTLLFEEILNREKTGPERLRIATFTYNGKLAIDPKIIEAQNYLEHTNTYKEYYLERTYNSLMLLNVFQVIKPVLVPINNTDSVDVHYYLVPSQKQRFGFSPKATNSNGYLGVSATVNYLNRNIFGGAQHLELSLSGGFESQPPVFDETLDGQKIKKAGRSFNTFEIVPGIKLDMPGLYPVPFKTLNKRKKPRTIISAAYNYQKRSDFDREIFQLNYFWKFYVSKTQIFQFGLPLIGAVKFVNINKTPYFQQKLDDLNDLFLTNAYSNQFVWQDVKLVFEYNNQDKDIRTSKVNFYMNTSFDPSGNILSLFKNQQDTNASGQRTIFGSAYSQFSRLDNDLIFSRTINKKSSLHAHLQIGGGFSYGNTSTSMPYDYSFFAGGANDNRGWRSRSLGPGAYKYYLDTNRTATQIGDIRIGSSLEYRFSLGSLLKMAVFADAGNVWTLREDDKRIGSQFLLNEWYKQIALSMGIGMRLDFDFFIVRLDLGIPVTNPALPSGAKWIFQSRQKYYDEGKAVFGDDYKTYLPKPFTPVLQFGIGYPF